MQLRAIARLTRTRRLLALVLVILGAGATMAGAAAVVVASGLLSTSSQTLTHASCTLTGSEDTYVDESKPGRFNDSSRTLSTESLTGNRLRIYIRFNLAGCASPIPSGAEVDLATLTLTTTAPSPATPRTLSVRTVTSNWAAATTEWGTQPTSTGSATTTLAIGTTNGAKVFDVTNDVNDFVQSAPVPTPPPYAGAVANFGWMISDEGASSSTVVTFASNENTTAANRPTLLVNYGY